MGAMAGGSSGPSLNAITIVVLVFSSLLFLLFMWFYLSPILRNKDFLAPATKREAPDSHDVETGPAIPRPANPNTPERSLQDWLRRGSRGRFAGTSAFHGDRKQKHQHTQQHHIMHRIRASTVGHWNRLSLFSRNADIPIPHIAPVTPPPAYCSSPSSSDSPKSAYSQSSSTSASSSDRAHSPAVSSPLVTCSYAGENLTVPRILVPSRRVSIRAASDSRPTGLGITSSSPSTLQVPGLNYTPLTRCSSAPGSAAAADSSTNTLHVPLMRVRSPSRAYVSAQEKPGANVSVRPGDVVPRSFMEQATRGLARTSWFTSDQDKKRGASSVPF